MLHACGVGRSSRLLTHAVCVQNDRPLFTPVSTPLVHEGEASMQRIMRSVLGLASLVIVRVAHGILPFFFLCSVGGGLEKSASAGM